MRVLVCCLMAAFLTGCCSIKPPDLSQLNVSQCGSARAKRAAQTGEMIPNTLRIYVVIAEDYTIKYDYLTNYANEKQELRVDTYFRTNEGIVYILRHRNGDAWRMLVPQGIEPGEHYLEAYPL